MTADSICMLSFDIEDWFQVENLADAIDRKEWGDKELRVIDNTHKLLTLLDKHNTKATFFILGWIADRKPVLVEKIADGGHEVASHGYGHQIVSSISFDQFREDLVRSKGLLEEIAGKEVVGYRAPNYSITEEALDILEDEGFQYDSSFFPSAIHDRYSKLISVNANSRRGVEKARDNLFEVLIPTLNVFGTRFPWGGGGYFRALPYSVFKKGIKRILNDRNSFVFYLHPWEIDPDQPRVKNIKLNYRFRHYIGLDKTESKLDSLLSDFQFIPIKEGLERLGLM